VADDPTNGRAAIPEGVAARPDTIAALVGQLGAEVDHREEVRVWSMSGVERLHFTDGRTVILKYAVNRFAQEPDVLRHAAGHGVPVPQLLASTIQPDDGNVVMLMEDLGEETCEAALHDAAAAAVAIHRCPALDGVPVLGSAELAQLPLKALAHLTNLQSRGRWLEADTNGIRQALERIAEVAERRAQGADIPPFGMCHSEFHPTSIHIGEAGMRILDWARAYTGPGLLDLVSWQGTPEPLDLGKVEDLLDAYLMVGGPAEAKADRGGLPAHVWAGGWDKMWITEWFMESSWRHTTRTDSDGPSQRAILRNLGEVIACLVK
jgi:phosphotransferase family enzyme